ncbi:AAA family ATPase [Methylobacterium hispanicum]|uniref:AAA family ATPase n=1 Tax=Methylobacterium hispanicum TaxID=270350 RepID=UPI003570B173
MENIKSNGSLFVAVTGAQGVGKSTFAQKIYEQTERLPSTTACLLNGLGQSIRAFGIPVGSAASADSIASVYAAHIERERKVKADIVVLDRCAIDALAYVRCLSKTSKSLSNLYEQVSASMFRNISLVVRLEKSGIFEQRKADHESDELRDCVDTQILSITKEYGLNTISLNAAVDGAIEQVMCSIAKVR